MLRLGFVHLHLAGVVRSPNHQGFVEEEKTKPTLPKSAPTDVGVDGKSLSKRRCDEALVTVGSDTMSDPDRAACHAQISRAELLDLA